MKPFHRPKIAGTIFAGYSLMVDSFLDAVRLLQARLRGLYDSDESAAISRALLEHHSGLPYTALLARDRVMTEEQKSSWQQDAMALMAGKPLQQVLGHAWFSGFRFSVNGNTLIPRPETEELVALAVSFCLEKPQVSILDIGTGSGCIAVSLKKKLPEAIITAIDISAAALTVAKKNAADLEANLVFAQMDFLQESSHKSLGSYDVIISNPPYIPDGEKESLHANIIRYEPHTALFVPDEDPLLFYRKIAAFATTNLLAGGTVLCELHADQAQPAEILFKNFGFSARIFPDLQGKQRMLQAWKP